MIKWSNVYEDTSYFVEELLMCKQTHFNSSAYKPVEDTAVWK